SPLPPVPPSRPPPEAAEEGRAAQNLFISPISHYIRPLSPRGIAATVRPARLLPRAGAHLPTVPRLSLHGPHSRRELKELIEELVNITQNQVSLCNGSMVWSVNLTTGMYCAALESLINVSDCTAIQRTQRMLKALCTQKPSAGQTASERSRDTKIEVIQLVKNLLNHLRRNFRHGNFK
uniref:Interleukin-13 n=1 Tax=Felis catus TaxID=9685 RepID=A0ABI7ZLZ6_FELCA